MNPAINPATTLVAVVGQAHRHCAGGDASAVTAVPCPVPDRYEAEAAQLLSLSSTFADGDAHVAARAAGDVLAWHLPEARIGDDACRTPSRAPGLRRRDDPRMAVGDRHDGSPTPITVPFGSPAVVQHGEAAR